MIHFSEFSGIGGFDLAAEWIGWKNYVSCEINPFGNKILEFYWPQAYHHTDITTLTYDTINHELSKRFGPAWRNDNILISGGFPCQPYSTAGKRLGKDDDRHLWPQMLRTIRESEPAWVVGENVRGLTNWNGGLVFNEVWSDLEAIGFEVVPLLLPACAVDAPHRRDRIWFVAHAPGNRWRGSRPELAAENWKSQPEFAGVMAWGLEGLRAHEHVANASDQGLQVAARREQPGISGPHEEFSRSEFGGAYATPIGWEHFPTQSPVCVGNDGLPARLDGIAVSRWRKETIRGGGNAIVPRMAYQIFQAIQQYENDCKL